MTKQELRNLRDRIRRCKSLENRRREIREKMDGLTAQAFTGTPGGGLAKPDARIVACLSELEKLDYLYADILAETTAAQLEAEKAMIAAKLSASETEVIRLYYFDVLKWDEVAARLCYSVESIFKIYGRAIQKLLAASLQ